jgi:hypothetical protein
MKPQEMKDKMKRVAICPCTICNRCKSKLDDGCYIAKDDLMPLCKTCSQNEPIFAEGEIEQRYKKIVDGWK